MTNYSIRPCTEKQLPEILAIYNYAILHTTALYDYLPRTTDIINKWYEEKIAHHHPVIGAFDERGILLGFATYGVFRPRPAYKYTVEHSVYIKSDSQGQGLGKALLRSIIEEAVKQDYHVMIGVIDSSNEASIRLHEKEGFTFCGSMQETGFKFGKWLNTSFYQLLLPTPLTPNDNPKY